MSPAEAWRAQADRYPVTNYLSIHLSIYLECLQQKPGGQKLAGILSPTIYLSNYLTIYLSRMSPTEAWRAQAGRYAVTNYLSIYLECLQHKPGGHKLAGILSTTIYLSIYLSI